jgi:dihydrofolate reductase
MNLALIAVLDQNNGIGKNNQLLCHLPADLRRFKQLTTGHCIIMGRKTFESLPNGPLPNRKNIIITRDLNYKADGGYIMHTIEEVLAFCSNEEKVFIIGGEQIYRLFIQVCDILHITKIDHTFDADVFFPEFTDKSWKIIEKTDYNQDDKNTYTYSFIDYSRNK